MLEMFERGSLAGGDLLSIESTGGKEVSDDSIMMCDIKGFVYSQAVLGVRDMHMLWEKIIGIARKHHKIAAGDTACGFGNTAMVMAEKGFIPKVFAAVARVVTVVRTLVAIEEGATGPDKDCGYEGPFLKAITGIPISMEGKTAACAHFSPMGNVAAACADLWSNESVQNIKLLSGFAPTVYLEQLEYDARLFNQATHMGGDHVSILQKMLVESDIHHDPQAFILSPDNVIKISSAIVSGKNYIEAAVKGALKALDLIEEAQIQGQLKIREIELPWIRSLREDLLGIPFDEGEFTEMMLAQLDPAKILLEEYGF
jgi:methanol--5-hydroxybenzimidazolylcobamide Co-methyltransferase